MNISEEQKQRRVDHKKIESIFAHWFRKVLKSIQNVTKKGANFSKVCDIDLCERRFEVKIGDTPNTRE